MGTTTSSYLIDTSKKCIIPRAGKDSNGLYWTAYGDVESKSLANFSYTYKEDFAHASKLLEDDFESLLAPVTQTIKAITKKVPILKNVNLNNTEELKSTALFLYSIYDAFVNTNSDGSSGESKTSQLASLFERPYLYDVPMRKSAPAITFNPGQSVIINFAYGKCNLFNAYEEVYKPLSEIHKNLFPDVKESTDKGLGSVTFSYNIPYEQQSFVEMVKSIIGDAAEGIEKVTVGSTGKGSFQTLTNLSAVANKISTQDDLLENVNFGSGRNTPYKKGNNGAYRNAVGYAIEGIYSKDTDAQTEVLDSVYNPDNPEDIKDQKLSDLAKDVLGTAIPDGIAKAADEKKELVIPKGPLNLKKNNTWKLSLNDIDSKQVDDNTSTKNLLADLINLKPRAVGTTLDRLANKMLAGKTEEIRLGYPPQYVTSLDDLKKELDEKEDTHLNPKITLKYLLFTKVSVSFDFSNTDEAGWPMAGSLKIEELWTVKYPKQTVEFDSSTDQDGLYEEKSITYNAD